ncbi:MAG: Cob(I)alamin adenosyltransferase [Candidatus Roizmanbacteria bacterium GW2011_GWC2_37_13]|uniref:Corrinoid adenosyltransferase n=1 Tax=Candidatus Roizmanbacteria bacterium GW2011_GWC2_37_13 TaxID=1618486 RepID=A0A0G0JDC6_9BACT|nr:MAG: Cob(I)alamin adenosyltransferase [Candidatus Roizmanbacteria bacterium GW2011_GWC1_37_12]KKQ26171.1 MAG: Cob(I)alamin adenosyltransferase [Candidatus Roizmanbacteria bacterium GW2011_GWC2_37_13]
MAAVTLNANMPIYTKTGDKGTTSLFGGKRVSKSDLQIEANGAVDELTSFVGLVTTKVKDKKTRQFLVSIQKDLYKIMSCLSGMKINLQYLDISIKGFEDKIDQLDKKLPRLNKFILPGGTEASAWFQILRVVCRRAERKVVAIKQYNNIIIYLNRLSDLFFTLARFYNRGREVVV